jgi:competence protein ComEC
MGILVLLIRLPSADLTVTFLDVGQGDAIFVATPDRHYYLFDGGSSSVAGVGNYRVLPYLKAQGISRIDGWFISHPDSDHYLAFVELAERMGRGGVKIKTLIMPDIAAESRGEEYLMLCDLAAAAGIEVAFIGRGQGIALGNKGKDDEVRLQCLSPPSGSSWPPANANAYSEVLLLEYRAFSLLLAGDVEGEGERELKSYIKDSGAARDVTVLKVAHHGSRHSTDADFLELAEPDYAVISAGYGNSYGHPHRDLLGRLADVGAEIFITYESGAVTFRTDGERMRVEEYLRR